MPPDDFRTTRWSVVLSAGGPDSSVARAALDTLCETYWFPLYVYLRRRGESAEGAEDLVQGFFCRLVEKRDLFDVAPDRGRFRAFLLAALKHFLANAKDHERARKRGGDHAHVPIDVADADRRYGLIATDGASPERVFERMWALALLERVLALLRADYEARGQARVFQALKATLVPGGEVGRYADIAKELGMSEGAVKVAALRLRGRYAEDIRAEIASTVEDPEDVDAELGALFEALGE